MRFAVVGGGVSGLVAASLLHERYEVTVFEARDRIGGHVNTVEVEGADGVAHAIDTGFIVYNEHNYPLFSKLLRRLGVASQASNMSFSVRCDRTGVEWGSATVGTLFAQRRNLVSPRFHAMVADILRFNREAGEAVRNGAAELSLGEYVDRAAFSRRLVDHYLVPMGSALWSVPRGRVLEMPAEFFIGFFENHGMLTVNDQPEWRVVQGGSARYVEALVRPFRDRIRTGTPVRRVRRGRGHVEIDGERFDHVVLACHADQALDILADASPLEREILGALPFQNNEIVLHTDTTVLPRARRAWSSWNYHIRSDEDAPATVTYNMNKLQALHAPTTYCVTLNATDVIDPAAVLHRTAFSHPVCSIEGRRAQTRHSEISGLDRTHFCGAYWGFGFHEDGVGSAVNVAKRFGAVL